MAVITSAVCPLVLRDVADTKAADKGREDTSDNMTGTEIHHNTKRGRRWSQSDLLYVALELEAPEGLERAIFVETVCQSRHAYPGAYILALVLLIFTDLSILFCWPLAIPGVLCALTAIHAHRRNPEGAKTSVFIGMGYWLTFYAKVVLATIVIVTVIVFCVFLYIGLGKFLCQYESLKVTALYMCEF